LNFIEPMWVATGQGGHRVSTNITWYHN
jgi:hypothetical protein